MTNKTNITINGPIGVIQGGSPIEITQQADRFCDYCGKKIGDSYILSQRVSRTTFKIETISIKLFCNSECSDKFVEKKDDAK